MIQASSGSDVRTAKHSGRTIAVFALIVIAIASAFIPWLSDDWIAIPALALLAVVAAWIVDRRHPWPWSVIIAACTIAIVTDVSLRGVSAGEANEFTSIAMMILMSFVVAVIVVIAAIRALAVPQPTPNPAGRPTHGFTVPAQATILAVCAIAWAVVGGDGIFQLIGITTAALAVATAIDTGRTTIPWLVGFAAATASLAANYMTTSDYYDLTTPGGKLSGSVVPDVILVATAVVTVAAIAAWGIRRKG